jgi:hypothetical protein
MSKISAESCLGIDGGIDSAADSNPVEKKKKTVELKDKDRNEQTAEDSFEPEYEFEYNYENENLKSMNHQILKLFML